MKFQGKKGINGGGGGERPAKSLGRRGRGEWSSLKVFKTRSAKGNGSSDLAECKKYQGDRMEGST